MKKLAFVGSIGRLWHNAGIAPRWFAFAVFSLSLSLSLASCSGGYADIRDQPQQEDRSPAAQQAAATEPEPDESLPTYVISVESNFPPFNMIDGNGKNVGFEIDLLDAAAKIGGINIKYRVMPFQAMFDELKAGRLDAVASGVTVNAERAKEFDFSIPYYVSKQAIFRPGSAKCDNGEAQQLDWSKDVVAAQQGSVSESFAATRMTGRRDAIVEKDTVYEGAKAALGGDATVLLSDSAPLSYFALNTGLGQGCQGIVSESPTEHYALAFAKGDPKGLKKVFDGALRQLIDSGQYAEIYKKWFGGEPPDLTAADEQLPGSQQN